MRTCNECMLGAIHSLLTDHAYHSQSSSLLIIMVFVLFCWFFLVLVSTLQIPVFSSKSMFWN